MPPPPVKGTDKELIGRGDTRNRMRNDEMRIEA